MSVTVGEFREYVGTSEVSSFVDECLTSALALVENYIGTQTVPSVIKDQATLLCASELFHRRSAPNGIAQFASMDGSSPMRVAKDPMTAVYSLLLPFVKMGV
jgi:hypothetical protein